MGLNKRREDGLTCQLRHFEIWGGPRTRITLVLSEFSYRQIPLLAIQSVKSSKHVKIVAMLNPEILVEDRAKCCQHGSEKVFRVLR